MNGSIEFEEVIAKAQAGEASALGELFRTFQPRVLKYLKVRALSEHEDIASDVWLEVSTGLNRFKGGSDDFRRWLFTIAYRRATDNRRKFSRRKTSSVETSTFENRSEPTSTEDIVGRKLEADDTMKLLEQLPVDQADILSLRIIAGLSSKEVARIMGKREGTIRAAQRRGLIKLQEYLDIPVTEPNPDAM